MKIDVEMTYDELIWMCQKIVILDEDGYKIERIARKSHTNELYLELQSLVYCGPDLE